MACTVCQRLLARRAAGAVGDAEELGLAARRARCTTSFSFSSPTGVFGGKNSKLIGQRASDALMLVSSVRDARPDKEFAVAVAAGDGAGEVVAHVQAARGAGLAKTRLDARELALRRLTRPPLPMSARLHLELRLHQQQRVAARLQRRQRRQRAGQRDERQVGRRSGRSRARGACAASAEPSRSRTCRPSSAAHARVGREPRVQLAVADVEADHARRAARAAARR